MEVIESSVGFKGVNKVQDVSTIQRLLKSKGFPNLRIDGICGRNTIKAILVYQKHFYHHPDGLVTPGKKTLNLLIDKSLQNKSALPRPHGATDINPRGDRHAPMLLSPSSQCIHLMMQYETLHTKTYDDQTGRDIFEYIHNGKAYKGATIGYGHLIRTQNEFNQYSGGISRQQAEKLFSDDLQGMVMRVRSFIKSPVTQNEFDAIVMLTFNIGPGKPHSPQHVGLYYSTVLKIVNGESSEDLDEAWMKYTFSQGHRMRGLLLRRKSELNVFHKGIYIKL